MEDQKKNGGWCKASVVLGVISIILALLPLVSAWFMFVSALNYFLAPIGIICGIVAIAKSYNVVKSVLGLVLCILALCAPLLLAEYYLASAAESVGNMFETMNSLGGC